MEGPPAPAPTRSRARLLIWVLAALAFASTAVADFAWTRNQPEAHFTERVTLEDLAAADLGANDPAPDFTVPTLDGGFFSLSAHLDKAGTPVVLNLWASWCLPCRQEMPALDAAARRYPQITFLGVAVQDDMAAAERFARELGVSYPIGLDERDEVNALYPTFGLPVTYLISAEGTILQPVYGELSPGQIDGLIATWFGG